MTARQNRPGRYGLRFAVALVLAITVAACGDSAPSADTSYWQHRYANDVTLHLSLTIRGDDVAGEAQYTGGSFQPFRGARNADDSFAITAYNGRTAFVDGDTLRLAGSKGDETWQRISQADFEEVRQNPPNDSASSTDGADPDEASTFRYEGELTAPEGSSAQGISRLITRPDEWLVEVSASGLAPGPHHGVWLFNSMSDTELLGFAPVGDDGELQTIQMTLDDQIYNEILVTNEPTNEPTEPGPIVLRGPMPRP